MGHAMVSGGARETVPSAGLLAGELAVGTVVKLMVNGTATEFLVVNQGIPSSSSLYDSSCDGTWLLMNNCYSKRAWHGTSSSYNNNYKNSDINSYLNGTFFNLFGSIEQTAIKQIQIPYVNGTGGSSVASGSNGLSVKVFLLGGYEVGWTTSQVSNLPVDGSCLSYFAGTSKTDSKRIAYFSGSAVVWYSRSANTSSSKGVWAPSASGGTNVTLAYYEFGIRPALIVPKTALFDKDTLILKGVA